MVEAGYGRMGGGEKGIMKKRKKSTYHQEVSNWVTILIMAIPIVLIFGALLIYKYIILPIH